MKLMENVPVVKWLSLLAVLGVVVLIYYPVLAFDYVWDDHILFVESMDLRPGTLRIQRIFEPILDGTTYFRPLVLLSIVAEYALFGVKPLVSHAINLLVFMLNVTLVYLLAFAACQRPGERASVVPPFIAALAYALVPLNVESVAWVSGRFDLLTTTFGLSSLYAALSLRRGWLQAGLVGICYFLALNSKEMAVTVPVIYVLMQWALRWRAGDSLLSVTKGLLQDSQERRTGLAFVLSFIAYLLFRAYFVPELVHANEEHLRMLNPVSWAAYVGQTGFFYLKKILFPFLDMAPHHPFNVARMDAPTEIGGLAMFAAGLLGAVFLVWRAWPAGLWGLLVLVSLMPVLNLIPLKIANSIGHERFLAFPFALVCVGVAVGLSATLGAARRAAWGPARYKRMLGYVSVIGSFWLAAAAITTETTLPLWVNDYVLWKWSYAKDPKNQYAKTMYLLRAINLGRLQEYQENAPTVILSSEEKVVQASYLVYSGKHKSAIPLLVDVLNRDDYFFQRWSIMELLAEAYLWSGEYEKLLDFSGEAMKEYPSFVRMRIFRSLALYGVGRKSEAKVDFADALEKSVPQQWSILAAYRDNFLREKKIQE